MKKITYFNVLVFTVLLLTMGGCNEDKFLKEDPRDALYPENLLVDYNGFKSMITPLYGLMRAEYRRADAMGGSIALCLHSAWGGGVDNSWANNSHAEMKFLYNPKEITYTDLAIWNNISSGDIVSSTLPIWLSQELTMMALTGEVVLMLKIVKMRCWPKLAFSVLGLTVTLPIHLVQCPFQHKKLQD